MELYIRLQVQTIAAAFAMGCAAALLYDLLRTLRLARRRRTVTHLTDLVYVLAVGWAFLQFALAIGQGELRLYVLPCAALGAIFSWRVLVPLFRPIWQFWLGAAVHMGRLLWQPVRMLLHFCKKVWISAEKAIAFFKKYCKIKLYRKKAHCRRTRREKLEAGEEKEAQNTHYFGGAAGAAGGGIRGADPGVWAVGQR